MDIILIHIGTTYPSYIDDCIKQLKHFNFKIHLIISDNLINEVLEKDIILSSVEEYENEKFKSYSITGYDKNFRDGFWLSTSSRFFILEHYVKSNNITNFYHIEYDNLLYDNLEEITEIISKQPQKMFIVIDSEFRCIPSIMFIKDYQTLSKLTNFMLENNNKNDMENLYNFYSLNRDTVSNLPIIPTKNNINIISNNNINYSNLFDELNVIFDGAAIGQYIGGVDPRNDSSNTIGFVNETTIFDVSKLDIIWEDNRPMLINNNKKIKICNLHIHSKKLNNYTINN